MASALSSSTVQSGWSCRSRAMMPAMCGDAIEVPEMLRIWLPARKPLAAGVMHPWAAAVQVTPVCEELMNRPGAAMSGLSRTCEGSSRGPRELKEARMSAEDQSVTLRPATFALSVLPSACWTLTGGMLTVSSNPAMLPKAEALLAMITPTAPAFWAFFALTAKPQVPRSTSAMLPATAAALVSGEQPSAVGGPAPSAGSSAITTLAVNPPGGGPSANAVAVPVRKLPAIPAGALTRSVPKAPKLTPLSIEAAVLTTRVPAPGAPVMKKVSPALPAEATTMTPAAAALSEAIDVELSRLPKFEPSDMLMTSRWSERSLSPLGSIAQSIAAVVKAVLPPQPNTRSA